ncbi:hypothetical protein PUMCH_000890 [Australozyma saopauloensis]|uniref:Restriction of telomere capping protein 4 n=1 Tax=Australozyma saopauloensis TaxID=291208 RepID=A0AAX4H562_9ASCO|nr:hypothetical protein PUMCH_000890 [[Candida] saopauloensis]
MSTKPLPLDQSASPNPETASSFRLPPISFLARDHASAPHFASLILPLRHLQAGPDQEPGTLPVERNILLEPASLAGLPPKEDIRSLPKPKALGLFPLQSAGEPLSHNLVTSLSSPNVKTENGNVEETRSEKETSVKEKRASPHHEAPLAKKPKGPPILDKRPLEKLLKSLYPVRRHLGTVVYNPTTTWETLQFEHLHGLQEHDKQQLREIRERYLERKAEQFSMEKKEYIPSIPPLSDACINSFLEVKIPYRFIKAFIEDFTAGTVQRKRELWGGAGGIYTDDSDILSVLCHLGLFDDDLDLTACNSEWEPSNVIKPLKILKDADDVELLDLSVTLIIYPGLNAYHGYYKNGINSRSWAHKLQHDGLSYGVFQVKWETCIMSMDERSIYKKSALEIEADRLYEASNTSKGGWRFDHKLYQRLQKEAQKAVEPPK